VSNYLFSVEECAPKAYVPDPRHVRNRLQDMLDKMRGAESWPWEPSTVRYYRASVWPYLYEKLADKDESARWRNLFEAEAARLEATT
jgi:hypothetical protein